MIKILTANKINILTIWLMICSIIFYSTTKYPLQETFKTVYSRIPGWIEPDDDVGRDIVSVEKISFSNSYQFIILVIISLI